MQIGFNAPTAGPLSSPDNLAKIVVGGEAMGFDYATFSDHVVIPTAIAAEYPYSASGEFPAGPLRYAAWMLPWLPSAGRDDAGLSILTWLYGLAHAGAVGAAACAFVRGAR